MELTALYCKLFSNCVFCVYVYFLYEYAASGVCGVFTKISKMQPAKTGDTIFYVAYSRGSRHLGLLLCRGVHENGNSHSHGIPMRMGADLGY